MSTTVINSKRVLKNTVYLYIRMFVMMLISLFTVRIVLKELGVVDYGIYNVVGSVVALCSFITGSLTAASNRFFSREMVKGSKESFNNCFCLNVEVFGILIIVAVLLLETLGVWYVNNKMVIPDDRVLAANVIFQFSILVLCFSFISIPYNSLVIIHEEMSVYAYISIIESVVKLLIVYLLVYLPFDKLISYGLLMMLISGGVTCFYVFFCKKRFEESKFHLFWDKEQFSELFSFVGWYFLGSLSFIVKSQGINLIINFFFNPAINAARAIAFNVEGAIKKFSDGFFTAAKPQIYKSYSNHEYDGLNMMISRTTIICVFLMSFFSIPISFNANTILTLWLGEVPDKAVVFLQLIIIDTLLNTSSEPVILSIVATGEQKIYQIIEFVLRTLTLPVSYIALKLGYAPEITVIVCILFSVVSVVVRAIMLKRSFSYFELASYLALILKIFITTGLTALIVYFLSLMQISTWVFLCISTLLSSAILIVMYYFFIMTYPDRKYLIDFIKTKIAYKL